MIASAAVDDRAVGVEDLDGHESSAAADAAGSIPMELVEPLASAVADLMDMGFSEARSRNALRHCANNVSIATNRLLEGMY